MYVPSFIRLKVVQKGTQFPKLSKGHTFFYQKPQIVDIFMPVAPEHQTIIAAEYTSEI